VKVILNKKVDRDLVQGVQPDVVVIATGATPATLDIAGANGENVVQANDVLAGKVNVGEKVVVIGGRHRGMEVALSLAKQGKKVYLVSRSEIGRDVEHFLYQDLRDRLIELGVPFYPFSHVLEIRTDGVSLFRDKEMLSLKAGTVVLAVGSRPQNKLAQELKDIVPEVHLIGDCKEPRNALEALNEGAELGFCL
jgi:pyruvate/2-oxoglutarate dehydrogenase complex dihydrolipoamide dehydrogenase (E3) component